MPHDSTAAGDNDREREELLKQSRELLKEEYKLIQGKIDKLGEDKFKVRTWCFTIFTAVVAAAKLLGVTPTISNAIGFLILFLPLIAAFQLVELRQKQIQQRLGERALDIEKIWRIALGTKGIAVPNLATYLVQEGRRERKRSQFRRWWQGVRRAFAGHQEDARAAEESSPRGRSLPPKPKRRLAFRLLRASLVSQADTLFYLVQYSVVAVVAGAMAVSALIGLGSPNRRSESPPALILQLGTNELRVLTSQTNVVVTNYIPVAQRTTNFVTVTLLTTNFIATNIFMTNTSGKP